MKRSMIALVVVIGAWSGWARGELTFYDPFNYSDVGTTLAPHLNESFSPQYTADRGTTWFKSPVSATVDPTVAAGSLSYPGLPTSTGNSVGLRNTSGASRAVIGTYLEGSTVYYSMIFRVTDMTGLVNTGTGSFLTGLNYQYPENPETTMVVDGMNSGSQSSMGLITIHAQEAGTSYNLGVAFRDAPAGTTRIFDTTPHTTADTLFLVVKFVLGAGMQDDAAYLYINPARSTFGGTEPAAATVQSVNTPASGAFDFFYNNAGARITDASGNPLSAIRSFILRNNSVEPAGMQVDELRVGTTWADVAPAPVPGDANGDGVVGRDDFALIDRGFASAIPPGQAKYSDGDFDFDGDVDSGDYLIIDQAFLAGGGNAAGLVEVRGAQFGAGYVAALVPEPVSGLWLVGCGLLLGRRRR